MNLTKNGEIFDDEDDKISIKKSMRKSSIKEIRLRRKNPLSEFSSEKRRFIDIKEYPTNSFRINKQIQFESDIFFNNKTNFDKSNEEVKAINDRIERGRNKFYNSNNLGQQIIRVNRNKNLLQNSECNIKLSPADIKWEDPKSVILSTTEHSRNLYKRFGPKGPNARQLKIYQFSDSENYDTLSGVYKNQTTQVTKRDEKNEDISQKIEKMVKNIKTLNDNERLVVKMRTSSLDWTNDQDWDKKVKALNDFYSNGKNNNRKKEKDITDKINRAYNTNQTLSDNKNCSFQEYKILYPSKNNQFEKFGDDEIKKMFGQKGINVYYVHKDPFSKGVYNTITLKVSGKDNTNEINKKVKSIQEELKNKNYKIKIEKGKEHMDKKKYKRTAVKNPGDKSGAAPGINISRNINEGTRFKIMPMEYRNRKGFTKEFKDINHKYKRNMFF